MYKFTNVNYNRSKNINKEEIKITSHMRTGKNSKTDCNYKYINFI